MLRGVREFTRQVAAYHEGPGPEGEAARTEMRRLCVLIFEAGALVLTRPGAGEAWVRGREVSVEDWEASAPMATGAEAAILAHSGLGCVSVAAVWAGRQVQAAHKAGHLSAEAVRLLDESLATIVSSWSGAVAIAFTPLPYPFVQMVHAILAIFVFTLPFTLARVFGWLTPLASALVAFSLLGINVVATELEMPFGDDANDLPVSLFQTLAHRDSLAILRARDAKATALAGDGRVLGSMADLSASASALQVLGAVGGKSHGSGVWSRGRTQPSVTPEAAPQGAGAADGGEGAAGGPAVHPGTTGADARRSCSHASPASPNAPPTASAPARPGRFGRIAAALLLRARIRPARLVKL